MKPQESNFQSQSNFKRDSPGVVLTAAIVGLGIAVLTAVSGGTTALSGKISSSLNAQTVATYTAN